MESSKNQKYLAKTIQSWATVVASVAGVISNFPYTNDVHS